jgi:hypothetical protein
MSALGYAQLLMAQPARDFAILDPVRHSAGVTVVGTLVGQGKSGGGGVGISATGKSSGKWYWEALCNKVFPTTYGKLGITTVFLDVNGLSPTVLGGGGSGNAGTVGYEGAGAISLGVAYNFGAPLFRQTTTNGAGIIVDGVILSTALDIDSLTVSFYRNGTLSFTLPIPAGTWYPAFQGNNSSPVTEVVFNFGQNAWSATTAALRARLLSSGYVIGLYA